MQVETEIFGIIRNVEKSFLKINSVIKEDGIEAIVLNRRNFENQFFNIIRRRWFKFASIEKGDSIKTHDEIYLIKSCKTTISEIRRDPTVEGGIKIISDHKDEKKFFEKVKELNGRFAGSRSGMFIFEGIFSILKDERIPVTYIKEEKSSNKLTSKFSIKKKDILRLKLFYSGIIKEAEEKYRMAIECLEKRDKNGFSKNLKKALDILPGTIS